MVEDMVFWTTVIGLGTAVIEFATAVIELATAVGITAVAVLFAAVRRHVKMAGKTKVDLLQQAVELLAHAAKSLTPKAIREKEGARPSSSPREVSESHSHDLKSFLETVGKIRSNSGEEFLNLDQGHPAYAAGCRGRINVQLYGDGPEENRLFRRLQRFPDEYHEEIQDLRTWQNFCAFAVAAYERHRLR